MEQQSQKTIMESFEELSVLKTTINAIIDRKVLFNYFREIVDNSEFFEFQNNMARNHINVRRPLIELKMDVEKAYQAYDISLEDSHHSIDQYIKNRTFIVSKEIIDPFKNIIVNTIKYVMHNEYLETLSEHEQCVVKDLIKDQDLTVLKRSLNHIMILNEIEEDEFFVFGIVFSVIIGESIQTILDNNGKLTLRMII